MHNQRLLFDWALIPAGTASIGGGGPGEGPRRSLLVPAFAIMKFAVTNSQFQRFIAEEGYHRSEFWDGVGLGRIPVAHIIEPAYWRDKNFNQPNQPVTGISYHEAQAFARWAGCRLPTEVEWQKAAGGTGGFVFPWGDDEPDLRRAHFAPGFSPASSSTRSVYELPSGDSPYGCRQMAGNVHEWCRDSYHYDTPIQRREANLVELRPSPRRVLKGGAWTTGAGRLRVAARWSAPPGLRDNVVGIRLACDGTTSGGEERENHQETSNILP